MEVEYGLEVEVMSNVSKQKDTSSESLADENWLAQYEAERKKEQELEEKLCSRYALFLVWPVVASENNASGISFLSTQAKIVPN